MVAKRYATHMKIIIEYMCCDKNMKYSEEGNI